ncbi:MAG: DUF6285 domain-containing protein [Moraxellaceae bacterium]
MREQPDGAALLAIARDVLRKELLPLLPKDRAYEALMIANAMSIAEQQLRSGEAAGRAEHQALQYVLKQDGDLAALNRVLAEKVRAGDMDANVEAQHILWDSVVQRVRESAPRALAAYGIR